MSDAMIPAALALLSLAAVLSVAAAFVATERQRVRRAARLSRALSSGPTRRDPVGGGSLAHARAQVRALVLRLGDRLSAVLGGEARETALDLATAGYRGRDALLVYAFLKSAVPLATVALGVPAVLLTRPWDLGLVLPGGSVIAAALALSMAVDFVVDHRRAARMARIRRAFPDMLELLVIASEAGLGSQPALARVAHELSETAPDLSLELAQMVSELRMTNDRAAALDRLTRRVPLPEIAVFAQTLDQSDRYGTPFARAMRTLIAEQRANRLMAVEEKAARLPVVMTIPLIFCIMPAVFVVLVGPAVLSVIDNILKG